MLWKDAFYKGNKRSSTVSCVKERCCFLRINKILVLDTFSKSWLSSVLKSLQLPDFIMKDDIVQKTSVLKLTHSYIFEILVERLTHEENPHRSHSNVAGQKLSCNIIGTKGYNFGVQACALTRLPMFLMQAEEFCFNIQAITQALLGSHTLK